MAMTLGEQQRLKKAEDSVYASGVAIEHLAWLVQRLGERVSPIEERQTMYALERQTNEQSTDK